jgi:hypothetical protein
MPPLKAASPRIYSQGSEKNLRARLYRSGPPTIPKSAARLSAGSPALSDVDVQSTHALLPDCCVNPETCILILLSHTAPASQRSIPSCKVSDGNSQRLASRPDADGVPGRGTSKGDSLVFGLMQRLL